MQSSKELSEKLNHLEELLNQNPCDVEAVITSCEAVTEAWPPDPEVEQVNLVFSISYRILGLEGSAVDWLIDHYHESNQNRLAWIAEHLIKNLLLRGHRSKFDWYPIQDVARRLALGWEMEPTDCDWLAKAEDHIPITALEAKKLLAPYFTCLEDKMTDEPYGHYYLAWKVWENGNPPFRAVFRDWLLDMDSRGFGTTPHIDSMDIAFSMHHITENGNQVVGLNEIENVLKPRLYHPHALIAAHAGEFLGAFYCDLEHRFRGDHLQSLSDLLREIAHLKTNRRAVAGGFLNGFCTHGWINPITELRDHLDSVQEGLSVEDWILDVLDDGEVHEPLLPGTMAFWFPIHEEYCADPVFAMRLVANDHDWIAYMCATENSPPSEGMEEVLEAIAEKTSEVSKNAQNYLKRLRSA